MRAKDASRPDVPGSRGSAAPSCSAPTIPAELEVLRAVAEEATLIDAAPRVLRALATELGAELAELWAVSADGAAARRIGTAAERAGDREQVRLDTLGTDAPVPGAPVWSPPGTRSPALAAVAGVRSGDRAILVYPIGGAGAPPGWLLFAGADLEKPHDESMRLLDRGARVLARELARLRADEQRAASEERWRAMINAAPLMMLSIDAAGIITVAEGAGLHLLDSQRGALVGASALEVCAHDPALQAEMRRAFAGETFDGAVDHGGRTFETRWSAVRGADGRLAGTVAVIIDVTHRRRAEAALFDTEERLRYVTMAVRDAIYDRDIQRKRVWRNEAYQVLFSDGVPAGDSEEWWHERIHPEDRDRVVDSIQAAFRTRSSSWSSEYRFRRGDGTYASIIDRGYVLYDREGRAMRMIGAVSDLSRRSLADALRDGQSRVLEVIALDAPLDEVLDTLCLVIEAQSQGLSCSVLVLDADGVHVRHAAGPSLPPAYVRALDGQHIGPRRGSCGTAMYWNRPVIVTDVLVDPLWDDHRDMALQNGFRACWSIPVVSHDGKVLGSFAMYYGQPRSPTPVELELIELAARLASIALERHQASLQLRASLQEKVVLLKEIHHRVKNNLQIINSLLALQAEKLSDPRVLEIFAESQNRVRAMAMVHESLYRSGDLARVRFAAHVDTLCAHLFRSYSAASRVRCELDIADVRLDLDRAIPCGLIINELVSNALKHAFPGDRAGRVCVRLEALPASAYALTVCDDGVGLSTEIEPERSGTLGLQLVADLTHQIGGTMTIGRDEGTSITVRFAETTAAALRTGREELQA
jgi:PAS domain S-box-containing protein